MSRIYPMLSVLILLALPMIVSACSAPKSARYRPYYDSIFEQTDPEVGSAFQVTQGVVSDLNDAYYNFEELRFYRRAQLTENGQIEKGESSVFVVTFSDSGEGITSLDDSRVGLRLQFEEDGRISYGRLGNSAEGLAAAFVDAADDSFLDGQSRVIFRDNDVAIGQFVAVFEGYRISANYRALVYDVR